MLPVIHMFWHGRPLSKLEQLSIQSFLDHGHTVKLHCYEQPQNCPTGVTLADANQLVPFDQLFRHSKTGSMATFSNWIRYSVLFREGGVWADTDVVCLKPLAFEGEYLFGLEEDGKANVAILGLPAGDPLAKWMISVCEDPNQHLPYDRSKEKRRKFIRRWLKGNKRGDVKWGELGPVGFSNAARHLGYLDKAKPFWMFYPIGCGNWRSLFNEDLLNNPEFLHQSYAIHLWNEMMKFEPGFDRDAQFPEHSVIEQLKRQHGIR